MCMKTIYALAFTLIATPTLAGIDCTTVGPQTQCFGNGYNSNEYISMMRTPGQTVVMSQDRNGNNEISNFRDVNNLDSSPEVLLSIPAY